MTRAGDTMPGVVLGTVGYMAPEQARGLQADPRADIFAAGAILYEMISGQRAFHGESPADTISAILTRQPPDLVLSNGAPLTLARIAALLEKNAGDRQSATDRSSRSNRTPTRRCRRRPPERQTTMDCSAAIRGSERGPIAATVLRRDVGRNHQRPWCRRGIARHLAHPPPCRLTVSELRTHDATTTVLEGAVRKSGDRLRITAQLVNTSDGAQIWSARYDRNEGDIFEIQDEIAAAIVENLKVRLIGNAEAPTFKVPRQSHGVQPVLEGTVLLGAAQSAIADSGSGAFREGNRGGSRLRVGACGCRRLPHSVCDSWVSVRP
jgi:serine/threonine protein kinase